MCNSEKNTLTNFTSVCGADNKYGVHGSSSGIYFAAQDDNRIYTVDRFVNELEVCFKEIGMWNYKVSMHPLQICDIFINKEDNSFRVFGHGKQLKISDIESVRFNLTKLQDDGEDEDEYYNDHDNYVQITMTNGDCLELYKDKDHCNFEADIDNISYSSDDSIIFDCSIYRDIAAENNNHMYINKGVLLAYKNEKYVPELVIPPCVEVIAPHAFLGAAIGSVIIRDCYIQRRAFEESKIESVEINSCSLENNAFSFCKNLKKVILKDVKEISENCFECCCSLKELDLGTCRRIWEEAFSECYDLEDVVLPKGCELLGEHIFDYTDFQDKINAQDIAV